MRKATPLLPFILVTSLFFMWGLANNMTDTLLAAFRRIMSMSDFQTSFVQMSFYGAYFCLALPAAIFIKRFTYKAGILLGLGMFIAGGLLFYPASITMTYGHFLGALFILAGGLSVLETTANPYIIAMGPEESGTRRLNFAQSFNPIGSITGVVLSKFFILSHLNHADATQRAVMSHEELTLVRSQELNAMMGPYVGVALFLLVIWLVIAFTKMPKASDVRAKVDVRASIGRLLKNSRYVSGVIAQFFYVGAQIGVWSFTIRYVMIELGTNEQQASSWYIAALVVFTVLRFVFTGLMKFFSPRHLLSFSAVLAIICTLGVVTLSGYAATVSLVAISACMSLMFPTIYGISVKGLGDDTKIGASGLIMAILGGAVLTAIQGQVSDLTGSIRLAYLVPGFCFLLIAVYGYFGSFNIFRREPVIS
ncbi:MAG: L-fucose:H+ symporter permease [Marinilabiliales bacterium]|nr:MAG: L-fucose:H+ symporter permease [Marinilabiliales bacterium]